MPTIGSRDLSESVSGSVEVTIEGMGSWTVDCFDRPTSFDDIVAQAAAVLMADKAYVRDRNESPWEVVSFEPQSRQLTVKQVQNPE